MDELPQFYIADDGQRIEQPAYEALAICQIVTVSPETGAVGPSLFQPGEHFVTDAIPCYQWKPLNRAAAKRIDDWIKSLPFEGQNVSLEFITEAAREVSKDPASAQWTHEQWSHHVMLRATQNAARRSRELRPNVAHRPNPAAPPMPFAAMSPAYPMEAGRAPPVAATPINPNAPRKARPAKPMPGA